MRSPWFAHYCQQINTAKSKEIMDRLSQFGDDPVTGNRSAGSKASEEAASFLVHKFQELGLKRVTKEAVPTAKWEFHGARFTYKGEHGEAKTVSLGGYASKYHIQDEWIPIVDGGEGTKADFDRLGDVSGKLVLVYIPDIWNGYWVNYPNMEAKKRGARGILLSIKYKRISEEAIVSLSIGSPSDAVAMGISIRDAKELKHQIKKAKEKQVMVCFSGDSDVREEGISYNVWGEIPGKTKQVLYLIAHYDGYYHSYFDDALGISVILGIASALLNSSYQPQKTIRIVAHGAEEWGRVNSDYDWSRGAYEMITRNHPEWVKDAFALINIDGNFPVPAERNFQIKTSMELYEMVAAWTKEYLYGAGYQFQVLMPTSTMSEEFVYAKQGIPCIVAADSFQESIYYTHIYHSTKDAESFGLDYETYRLLHILYGAMLLELDAQRIRPMHFDTRFLELERSLENDLVPKKLVTHLKRVIQEAKQLSSTIDAWNTRSEKKTEEKENRFNDGLMKLSHKMQERFLRLDWDSNLVFPHENSQHNIVCLREAIKELKKKDPDTKRILREYIEPLDMNQHVLQFSYETYTFLAERKYYKNEDTWGWRQIVDPNEDLYEVAHVLNKHKKENPEELAKVIRKLEEAKKRQEGYFYRILKEEEEALYEVEQALSVLRNQL